MAICGFLILIGCLLLIGIGIAISLAACALTAILLALGITSSSLAIALRTRRAALGLRVFLLQCGILAGLPAGATSALLIQTFITACGHTWPTVAAGALAGALVGIGIALSLDSITRLLPLRASARLASLTPRRLTHLRRSPGSRNPADFIP